VFAQECIETIFREIICSDNVKKDQITNKRLTFGYFLKNSTTFKTHSPSPNLEHVEYTLHDADIACSGKNHVFERGENLL